MSRIGIFSGTFDPVHAGHIGFALQALGAARLDKVMLLPERRPWRKRGITHYVHRLAMLKRAVAAHPKLEVLELPDQRLYPKSVARLNGLFPQDELFLVLGSDHVYRLNKWPMVEVLLRRCGLIIGIRGADQEATMRERLQSLPVRPPEMHVIASKAPQVSSQTIREALRHGHDAEGLLASVKSYSKKQWLYASAKASGRSGE